MSLDYSKHSEEELCTSIQSDIGRVRELWLRNDVSMIKCSHQESYYARLELEGRGFEFPPELALEEPDPDVPDFEQISLEESERTALNSLFSGRSNSELETLFYKIEDFVELRAEEFSELLAKFRGKLFHTTPEKNLGSICKAKAILPSDGILQGAVGYDPGNRPGDRNLGHNLGAVSLWDLGEPSRSDWLRRGSYWLSEFRTITKSSGILFELDRDSLASGIRKGGLEDVGRWLGEIEVFHIGPIPLSAVQQAYRFKKIGGRFSFEELELSERKV